MSTKITSLITSADSFISLLVEALKNSGRVCLANLSFSAAGIRGLRNAY